MREQSGEWFGMLGSIPPLSSGADVLAEKVQMFEGDEAQGLAVPMADGEDAVARLKVSLAQREAACLRLEGQNFLLSAQVQQLQQQAQETSREVQSCHAQLAQALQVLDSSVAGRMPLKADVDHVKAIVANARRSVRRLANGDRGSASSVGTLNPNRMKAGPVSTTNQASGSGEAKPTNTKASPRGESRSIQAAGHKDRRRSPARTTSRAVSTAGTGGTGNGAPEEAVVGSVPGSPLWQCARPVGTGRDVTPVADEGITPRTNAPAPVELKEMSLRQRELLLAALRRGALQEASISTLKDDITRKEVIIHNLKQEQYAVQQETQNQQQLFESQMQQLQQQHHVQQLQQVQQLQEYEALLHQHHALQQMNQLEAEAVICPDDATMQRPLQ